MAVAIHCDHIFNFKGLHTDSTIIIPVINLLITFFLLVCLDLHRYFSVNLIHHFVDFLLIHNGNKTAIGQWGVADWTAQIRQLLWIHREVCLGGCIVKQALPVSLVLTGEGFWLVAPSERLMAEGTLHVAGNANLDYGSLIYESKYASHNLI